MNKRLLTDKEIAKPTTEEELALYTSLSEMELGRQDAKTLKEVGEWLRENYSDDIVDSAWEEIESALKQGKL